MSFLYKGVIPASKSIMNRALICSSYSESLKLSGDSSCDDVVMMKNAIHKLRAVLLKSDASHNFKASSSDIIYDCGAAGTALRFLTLRLSRISGRHVLKGTPRLMQRPQQDLLEVLTRVGVKYTTSNEHLILESEGWKNLDQPIQVQRGVSSQFASSLILNAWNLDSDLTIDTLGNPISEGYLEMTIEVVKHLGMQIIETKTKEGSSYFIKKKNTIQQTHYQVESDLSSAFAIAAYAALNGEATFEDFPHPNLQPDYEFIKFMTDMGISIQLNSSSFSTTTTKKVASQNELRIRRTAGFRGVECNLQSCPDLFPVLAVLCAFAKTPSRLYGAPQLVHKESNRIAKTAELLSRIDIPHEMKSDGMIISPKPLQLNAIKSFSYDTDHDHRLAFAAALLQSQNIPIEILHPEVVSKSFPEFWTILKKTRS